MRENNDSRIAGWIALVLLAALVYSVLGHHGTMQTVCVLGIGFNVFALYWLLTL